MAAGRASAIIRVGFGSILLGTVAHAGTLTTLYTFTGGLDGAGPTGALAYAGGVFYGTTLGGGCLGGSCSGTIFKVTP